MEANKTTSIISVIKGLIKISIRKASIFCAVNSNHTIVLFVFIMGSIHLWKGILAIFIRRAAKIQILGEVLVWFIISQLNNLNKIIKEIKL
jgi:hypothetical protein